MFESACMVESRYTLLGYDISLYDASVMGSHTTIVSGS